MSDGDRVRAEACEVTREEDIRTLGGGVLSPLSPPLTDKPHPLYGADVSSDTPPPPPVEKWAYTEIIAWLTELGFSQYESKFNHHAINNGAILMQLTEEHLEKMGISIIGHRLAIVTGIDQLRRRSGLLPAAKFVNVDFLLEEYVDIIIIYYYLFIYLFITDWMRLNQDAH